MKTTLDKILQLNRIVKATQVKAVRLFDANDTQGMIRLVDLVNRIFVIKNKLDPNRRLIKVLTLDIMLENIEHVRNNNQTKGKT